MKIVQTIILLILAGSFLNAQDTLHANDQEIIESILENSSDEQDIQEFGEELEYLKSHPINIAKPNFNQLLKLPFVSPLLAESIILFSDTVLITDVNQIRAASLMTDMIFERLLPFIFVKDEQPTIFSLGISPLKIESRLRAEKRLQTTKGFDNNTFLGDPFNSYERVRIRSANLEVAGLFEKDAGELYSDGLIAGYVTLRDAAFLRELIVGNFNISSAQGLVFAKNIAVTKGNDAVGQTRKRGNIISPSVSTDEFRYFQGAASQIQFNNITLMGFYSSRKLSASIDSNGSVTSFFTSGIYRTNNELKHRNTLNEKTIGGRLNYFIDGSKNLSVTLMNASYDHFISQSLLDIADKKSISAGSVSWEIPMPGFVTFGEVATNDINKFSKIVGIFFSVSKNLAVNYHHRSLSKGYVSPFARPFGERSNISDGEQGNYLGIEIKKEFVTVNAYLDYFTLPSTTNEFGSVGKETYVNISVPINGKFVSTFQIRNKDRSHIGIKYLDDERFQTNYRMTNAYKVTRQLSLSYRIEEVRISYYPSNYSEKGVLSYIEGEYKIGKYGLRLKSRLIFFDTQSYDSRLYQYESDVPGNYSNPPLYGKGLRWYVVAGYEFFDNFTLSFKYSETKKLNQIVLGNGDDEIQGNIDNQIAMQLDFQF